MMKRRSTDCLVHRLSGDFVPIYIVYIHYLLTNKNVPQGLFLSANQICCEVSLAWIIASDQITNPSYVCDP
jgi:hypothetical protein